MVGSGVWWVIFILIFGFFFPVFLTFCQRATVEGGFGRYSRRAGLKDTGIRAKGDVCSTRVWMKGGLEPVMGSCALDGVLGKPSRLSVQANADREAEISLPRPR